MFSWRNKKKNTVFYLITALCTYVFQNYLENLEENMYLIRAHFKERLADDFMKGLLMMLTQYLFLIVFIKAYAEGTHLNCIDAVCTYLNCLNMLRQFKWVHTAYAFIKK